MSYADKTLTCRECAVDFVFPASEQEFYAQKGFTNEPSRCPSCRQQRKATASSRSDASYRDSAGDRDSYRASNGGTRQSREPIEMHRVICASCGRETQVPFVPRADKPVYCSECFQMQRPTLSRGSRW